MAFFKYRGYKCSYTEDGSKGNRRIIIIPGEGQTRAKIFPMINDLVSQTNGDRESFIVTTVDFLGQGNSDKPKDFVSDLHRDRALQLKELFYQAGYEKANFVGMMSGSRTVIEFVKEAPQLVEMAVVTVDDLDKSDILAGLSDVPAGLEDKITIVPKSMKLEGKMNLDVYAEIFRQIIEGDTEKCPYCGEIMMRQYISTDGLRGEIARVTIEKDKAKPYNIEENGGFILANRRPEGLFDKRFSLFRENLHKTAYTCRSCKKMIVDIKDLI